jgi:hypothetical protein
MRRGACWERGSGAARGPTSVGGLVPKTQTVYWGTQPLVTTHSGQLAALKTQTLCVDKGGEPKSSKHMISADPEHLCFADTPRLRGVGGGGNEVVWRTWRPYLVAPNKYCTRRLRRIHSSGALWLTLSAMVLSEIYLLRNAAKETAGVIQGWWFTACMTQAGRSYFPDVGRRWESLCRPPHRTENMTLIDVK